MYMFFAEIQKCVDEVKDFSRLSEKSFEFWNNEEDDIYQKFYIDQQK